jgi:hypothetical protein
MKLSNHLARRLGVAAAAAGAAILIPAVALAAPGRAAGTDRIAAPQDNAPRCLVGQVTPWLGVPGNGTAGSTFYQLEISNTSARTCTLIGFPGVSAVGGGSVQLGSAAGRDASSPARLITLAPGATSHVELQVTDVGNFPPAQCHAVTADGLRVFAPNDFNSHIVPFSFSACSKAGPVFLHVSPVAAGTGIPGFTN